MTMDAWEWLEQVRALDGELCARMGLRAVLTPKGSAAVEIPYQRGGERYGAKVRAVDDKRFHFVPSGVEHGLYNADVLADDSLRSQPIVVTEGEFDCLSVIQAGFVRAVSIPDGWTEGYDGQDQGAKSKPLWSNLDALKRSPCVIVAGDNDPTGRSFVRAVGNILDGHPVRYVEWPDGCKDANDVLRQHGAGEVARCINAAKMLDPKGGVITGFDDLPPTSERRILRMNLRPFDKVLAFETGAMSVGTGTPGSGKSTFLTFACHHVARNEGVRVGFMPFETDPMQMLEHLALLHTGCELDDIPRPDQWRFREMISRHWRLVHKTEEAAHNLAFLREMVRTLAVRDGCKMIVIDPWNELEHMPEPGESMTNYINFALQQIRFWAERYGCHICVIAHPRKVDETRTPTGYDIADSAAFYNKPSLGFTVHRHDDPEDPHVSITTWKVRSVRRYGFDRGKRLLMFDPNAMIYYEKPRAGVPA